MRFLPIVLVAMITTATLVMTILLVGGDLAWGYVPLNNHWATVWKQS